MSLISFLEASSTSAKRECDKCNNVRRNACEARRLLLTSPAIPRKLTLLVVSDKSLGDSLTDGVDLGHLSTALDAHTHVDARKAILKKNRNI